MTRGWIVLAILSMSPAQEGGLRLRLEAGRTYRLPWTLRQTIRQVYDEQEQEIRQVIRMWLEFAVEAEGEDGTARARATWVKVYYKQEGPQGTIVYDPDGPRKDVAAKFPAEQVMEGLMGESIRVVLDATGRVREITGEDELIQRVTSKMEIREPQRREDVTRSVTEQLSEGALKEAFERFLALYSEGGGDTWSLERTCEADLPYKEEATVSVEKREGGRAVLKKKTKIRPNEAAGPRNRGGIRVAYEVSGTEEGEIVVDERTGWPVRMRLDQKIRADLTIEGAGGEGGKRTELQVDGTLEVGE